MAALTLRRPPPGDYFTPVFYENGRVTGFGSGTGEALMFSGSHCVARRVFDVMPDKDVFGMVDQLYQPLLQQGETIAAELGMSMDQAIRQTYADLYRQARRTRSDLGENMVFPPEEL